MDENATPNPSSLPAAAATAAAAETLQPVTAAATAVEVTQTTPKATELSPKAASSYIVVKNKKINPLKKKN